MRQGREGRYSDVVMRRLTGRLGPSPLRTTGDGLDQAPELSLWMGQDWQCSATDSLCLPLFEGCSQALNSQHFQTVLCRQPGFVYSQRKPSGESCKGFSRKLPIQDW